jgi:mono/diheme cytochrome c family protein
MSLSRFTSLVTGAVVFVLLGIHGLAAAQFGLTGPGMAAALLTDTDARVEQGGAPVEKTCNPCRSLSVAGDSNDKKAPPFRGRDAQPASLALREPLVRGIAAPYEEKLRFTPAVTLIVEVGDTGKGLAYAQQVCSGCHNVLRTDAASPNPQAPAFKKVANTPGMSITALTVWSQTTHPTMPNLVIEPGDMDNLIAYILSLRDR